MKKIIYLLFFSVSLSPLMAQHSQQPAGKKSSTKTITGINPKKAPKKKSNDAVKSEIKKIEADKTLTPSQKKQKIRSIVQQQKASRTKQPKTAGKP